MSTGQRIAAKRKEMGITQESLSEISGISLRTIQRIEREEVLPRAHTLEKLASQLQLDLRDLTTPEKDQSPIISNNTFPTLRKMNAAGFTVVLFPALPLLISSIIWWTKREVDETLSDVGKRILGLHILWIVLTILFLFLVKIGFYYITGSHSIGRISPLVPAYFTSVCLYLLSTIIGAVRLQKNDVRFFRPIPVFL